MKLHRNSQKRLYVPDGIYFITTNTYDRYPYFKNDILCELFLETLNFTSLIKEFNLHGFAINLEHIHLLIEPTGKYNYSEIMGTLKRNFSRDCNDLMLGKNFLRSGGEGVIQETGSLVQRFQRKYIDIRGNQYFIDHLSRLAGLQAQFFDKNDDDFARVRFKWQSSFRDHLIKDETDYLNHMNYILKQPIKHQLPGRKWYWATEESGDETDYRYSKNRN